MLRAAILFCFLGILAGAATAWCAAEQPSAAPDGWAVMPAGARSAFLGLHGGTMPVSLLVYKDGAALVAFVGRTGNDFMALMQAAPPVPSFFSARERQAPPSATATAMVMAGSAADSLPVLNLDGGRLAHVSGQLQPFGLSATPLPIEGEVAKPLRLIPIGGGRLLFTPAHLQPRRGKN